MIVNCEGCESGFHVDERLLKPGGSKVRCSKCRHVFVVYPPPPPIDDSEEPLVLSEEMAPAGEGAVDADMASIAAKLDEIFDDAPAPDPTPTAEVPEMLDVADLLAEEPDEPVDPAAEKGALDLDLDLSLDAGTAAEAESATQPPAAGAPAEEEIDFNLDLAPAGKTSDTAGDLPDLDELELDLSALEAAVDDAAPAPEAEAESEGAAGQDLELNLDFEVPGRESAAAGMAAAAEAAGQNAAGPSSEDLSLDLINELNLDLDSASEATTTTLSKNGEKSNPLSKTDQINLEDLESLIDDLEPVAAEPADTEPVFEAQAEPASAEAQEIDLSFLNDAGDETPAPPAAAKAALPEPVGTAGPQTLGVSDELDFSDLSNILEGEQPQEKRAKEISDIELVLDDAAPAAEACYPLMGPDGVVGAIEISKDITRDIMMQRSLLQQEKLASIGRLSAGVAHEINNPLTTVLTTVMLLQEDLAPEDPLYAELETIAKETLRCRKIVASLLDFARQGNLRKEIVSVNPIVAESVALARKQAGFKGIQVTPALTDGLPEVLADSNQLQQAFINLLVNAIEATPSGGSIEVATFCDPGLREIRIVISDSGCGMPKDVLEKIFDPFYTTKPSGTGLGLAITHGIIEQHGGRIDVDSSPDQGTTFMVILPAGGGTP